MPDTSPEDASESTVSLERTPAGAAGPDRDTEAARLRFDLAIDAAGIGGFDYDLTTGRLTWDDRLIELFGYRPDEFEGTIEAFFARLHPDDVARTAGALQAVIDECGTLDVEYRVVLPSGETRWVQGRGWSDLKPC